MPTLTPIKNQLQLVKKQSTLIITFIFIIIATNPEIQKQIETGVYLIIPILPKVVLEFPFVFMLYIVWNRASASFKKLACILIDEAYLIWGCKIFLKNYAELGTLGY